MLPASLELLQNMPIFGAVREDALQVLLEDFESAPLPVHVVHHEGRRATRKVRAFVDLAVDGLRADSALG